MGTGDSPRWWSLPADLKVLPEADSPASPRPRRRGRLGFGAGPRVVVPGGPLVRTRCGRAAIVTAGGTRVGFAGRARSMNLGHHRCVSPRLPARRTRRHSALSARRARDPDKNTGFRAKTSATQ